jgi:hypothetical protein
MAGNLTAQVRNIAEDVDLNILVGCDEKRSSLLLGFVKNLSRPAESTTLNDLLSEACRADEPNQKQG